MRFFSFSELRPKKWFFVGETKIIPGRDARLPGEAVGRPVAITWFEQADEDANGVIVQRVNSDTFEMELMLSSPAEIMRAAGCYPAAAGSDTVSARDVEIELEGKFMDYSLTVFTHGLMASELLDDPFAFHLSEPVDAEQALWTSVVLEDMTKMGLARRLEATPFTFTSHSPRGHPPHYFSDHPTTNITTTTTSHHHPPPTDHYSQGDSG